MKQRRRLLLILFMAGIVAVDQGTKALTRAKLPYGAQTPLLPGVLGLTYVRNSGAAFSVLPGARWFFLALVVVFFLAGIYLIRRKIFTAPFELWCLAAIGGGALGNAVDRAIWGEVTDMIEPLFMCFAVFNVADIFITCGAVALMVYVVFFENFQSL
ncbi:MAG: signal peptidase II [Oscillospiraceae bacterium]|nr:signal peptidase II [Oscillospiraceae bacterium]